MGRITYSFKKTETKIPHHSSQSLKRSRGEAVICTPKIYLYMLFLELADSILCSSSSPVLTDLSLSAPGLRLITRFQLSDQSQLAVGKQSAFWSLNDILHSCFWQYLETKDWEAVCMSGTVATSEIFLCSSVDKREREDGKCAARLIMKGDLCITDMTKGKRFLILKCSQVNKRRANCRRKQEN